VFVGDVAAHQQDFDQGPGAVPLTVGSRKAVHFLAFTSIACTLICYRRLTS
jgi:hypothetical protein